MEKVVLQTTDIAAENAAKLAELFPDVLTEVMDEDGNVRYGIDAEALRAHVGDIAEDKRERYQFTWPGKQRARAEAIRPIDKTMRPCPEESVNWDTTENLYIEGDNLDALKILRETYAGKIKMIYIDPPYNTGHDFVYNDFFARSAEEERAESGAFDEEGNVLDKAYKQNNESNGRFHSDWCSMMYPRLVLARDLLSEDGVIFISIDDNEVVNLQKLSELIFGASSIVAAIPWRKRTAKSDVPFGVSQDYEWILCVAKSSNFVASVEGKERRYFETEDYPGKPWRVHDMTKQTTASERPKSYFTMVNPKNGKSYPANPNATWRITEDTFQSYYEQGRIVFPGDYDFLRISKPVLRYWKDDDIRKAGKSFGRVPLSTKLPDDIGMSQDGTREIQSLFSSKVFNFPKPSTLLKYLVSASTDSDDLVFDFFSGSAPAAHAVMQLNAEDGGSRKFIMVQLPEVCDEKSEAAKAGYSTICEIGKERIRRAGAKIAAEVEESNAQLKLGEEPKKVPDIGFRVLKIDSSNFKDVKSTPDAIQQDQLFGMADNLKPARTPEDILFQLFPQFEIPFTARIEKLSIGGRTVYSVDDDTLLACFDREVSEDVIRAMATRQPLRAVLRDASFIGDDALTNFEEIFKTLSPSTETRVV